MLDFLTLLRENPYPGRGILVSRDLVYYFIMGRSANSRNRIFVNHRIKPVAQERCIQRKISGFVNVAQ